MVGANSCCCCCDWCEDIEDCMADQSYHAQVSMHHATDNELDKTRGCLEIPATLT